MDKRLPLSPPGGTQDLLPREAEHIAELGRVVSSRFASHGYLRVTTPPFEHAEVLERGLPGIDPQDLLRFVEPDTGEVALLRPDITTQIARIAATRLSDRPAPLRLSYLGSVVRRRHGRARRQRQIYQAGIELCGASGQPADLEVLELASAACRAVGLDDFQMDLAHASIGNAVLARVAHGREDIADAIARKDARDIDLSCERAGVKSATRDMAHALATLYGPPATVLASARRLLKRAKVTRVLRELEELIEALETRTTARLSLDLGELRGRDYYTGVSFTVLAEGPGEAIASGGRYDDLIPRFGRDLAGVGFAFDLSHLAWALSAGDRRALPERDIRVVAGDEETARALRAQHIAAAVVADEGEAYARAWDFDAVVRARRGEFQVKVIGEDDRFSLARLDQETVGNLSRRVARVRKGASS